MCNLVSTPITWDPPNPLLHWPWPLLPPPMHGPLPPCVQATQSFNVGEGPERAAVTAARARGLEIPPDFAARQFDPGADMARCDLVLVMDKFTASDVLREASGLAVEFWGGDPVGVCRR